MFHVKHQLLNNNKEKNSFQKTIPHNSTTPPRVSRETRPTTIDIVKQKAMFHVKQPNRPKTSKTYSATKRRNLTPIYTQI